MVLFRVVNNYIKWWVRLLSTVEPLTFDCHEVYENLVWKAFPELHIQTENMLYVEHEFLISQMYKTCCDICGLEWFMSNRVFISQMYKTCCDICGLEWFMSNRVLMSQMYKTCCDICGLEWFMSNRVLMSQMYKTCCDICGLEWFMSNRVFDFPDVQDLLWYLWIGMVIYVKQSVWFPRCIRSAVFLCGAEWFMVEFIEHSDHMPLCC